MDFESKVEHGLIDVVSLRSDADVGLDLLIHDIVI